MIMVAMKVVINNDNGDKRSTHAVSTIWPTHLLNATKLSYRLDFSFTIAIDQQRDLTRQNSYTIKLPQYRLNAGVAYEEIFFSISR